MTYFYTFIPSGLSYHFSPNLKSFISIFDFVQLVKKSRLKKKKQQEKKGICIKVMIQLLTQWGIRTILTLSHRATRMAL